MLPSPAETLREVPRVFGERKLIANTVRTLMRVCLGFGLTAAVGVPLGVLAACFPAVRSFLAPLTVFGRNIPVAALIPLTFFLFGIGEFQKVMFLFIASVAFVVSDTTAAVLEVPQRYVDTALTLGASQTWRNDSTSALTVNGNIANGSSNLLVRGTGNTAINSIFLGSGSGGLTKYGTGTLTVTGNNGANTFTGPT